MKTKLRTSITAQYNNGLLDAGVKALTTSHVINACAVMLGAGSALIGFLQAVPSFSNLTGLLTAALTEQGRSAKKLAVITSLLARPFWFFAAIALLFYPHQMTLPAFVLFYTVGWGIAGMTGGAFWPLIKSIVPKRISAQMMAARIQGILIVRVGLSAGIGWLLTQMAEMPENNLKYFYAGVFCLAGILGLYATRELTKITPAVKAIAPQISLFSKMALVLRHKQFLHMVMLISAVSFSSAFILPFTSVYLMKGCQVSAGFAILWATMTQIIDATAIKFFAKYCRNNIQMLILGIALLMFMVCALMGTSFGFLWTGLVMAAVFMGLGNSVLNLGLSDAIVFFVPKQMSAMYIAFGNVTRFVAAAIGPILAGLLLTGCPWNLYFGITGLLLSFVLIILFFSRQIKI